MASVSRVEKLPVIPRLLDLGNRAAAGLGITATVVHHLSQAGKGPRRRWEHGPTPFFPIIPSPYYYDLILSNLR
jgi:hypothetical protein